MTDVGTVVVGRRGVVAEPDTDAGACACAERRMGVAFCLSMAMLEYGAITNRVRGTPINVGQWAWCGEERRETKRKGLMKIERCGVHSFPDCQMTNRCLLGSFASNKNKKNVFLRSPRASWFFLLPSHANARWGEYRTCMVQTMASSWTMGLCSIKGSECMLVH